MTSWFAVLLMGAIASGSLDLDEMEVLEFEEPVNIVERMFTPLPPLSDLGLFPDAATVGRWRREWWAVHVTAYHGAMERLHRSEQYHAIDRQAQWAYQTLGLLESAHIMSFTFGRRQCLADYREAIGPELYYQGYTP